MAHRSPVLCLPRMAREAHSDSAGVVPSVVVRICFSSHSSSEKGGVLGL